MKGSNGCSAGLHRSFWRALHQLSRFILTTRWLKEKSGKRISYFSLFWNLFRYFVLLEHYCHLLGFTTVLYSSIAKCTCDLTVITDQVPKYSFY